MPATGFVDFNTIPRIELNLNIKIPNVCIGDWRWRIEIYLKQIGAQNYYSNKVSEDKMNDLAKYMVNCIEPKLLYENVQSKLEVNYSSAKRKYTPDMVTITTLEAMIPLIQAGIDLRALPRHIVKYGYTYNIPSMEDKMKRNRPGDALGYNSSFQKRKKISYESRESRELRPTALSGGAYDELVKSYAEAKGPSGLSRPFLNQVQQKIVRETKRNSYKSLEECPRKDPKLWFEAPKGHCARCARPGYLLADCEFLQPNDLSDLRQFLLKKKQYKSSLINDNYEIKVMLIAIMRRDM